jgi:prepilin-type processing-associated H-X9-DG protein
MGTVDSAWVLNDPVSWHFQWWWLNGRRTFKRVGSYSANDWVCSGGLYYDENDHHDRSRGKCAFRHEGEMTEPSNTPLIGDGIHTWSITSGFGGGPVVENQPVSSLVTGAGGMAQFLIPRHGSRPRHAPTDFRPSSKLPGAINMSFYDGHVQTVKLEQMWSLYWHKEYVVPAKRPGL